MASKPWVLRTEPRTLSLEGFQPARKGWQDGPVSTALTQSHQHPSHGTLPTLAIYEAYNAPSPPVHKWTPRTFCAQLGLPEVRLCRQNLKDIPVDIHALELGSCSDGLCDAYIGPPAGQRSADRAGRARFVVEDQFLQGRRVL